MKLRKIVSAISALAVTMSMVTVANAAALGGKPTVTATFDSYEKVSDTVAFAYVNVTIDMSAAEALEVYSNELDETTWEEVVKGNGITTMGSAWSYPSTFTYTNAKSTIPTGLTVNASAMAFGPKTSAEEYWTDAVTTIKLALRVNDFDAKGDFTFTDLGTTIDGKNSAESAVWAYAQPSTITVTGCSIPSYNEWSTPAVETYQATGVAVDTTEVTEDLTDKQVVMAATPVDGATLTAESDVYASYDGADAVELGNVWNSLGITGEGTAEGKTITVAVVCADDLDASKFTFEIK